MKKCIYLLIFAYPIIVSSAYAAKDEFWKDCPGPACPANVPDFSIDKESSGGNIYEHMDQKQLEKEREKLEDSIKQIDREDDRRGFR